MERNRGGRRTSAENFNVISKRRHRISSLRNAPEEEKQMEERVRLRDREQICKKERDRLYGKRKRTSSTGSDGSSENNEEEEDYEEEERKVHRSPNLPPKQTLPSSSMSIRHRRTVAPARVAAKSSPANEIIGLHIPKKARSVKRTYEYCNSGTGQFGEEKNHRRLSPLSTSRCVDGGLPSSSSISSKTKKLLGPKTRHHMIFSNSSSLIQDEIEVAEALFDLMKQSRSPSQSLSPSQGSMKRSDYSNEKICSSSSIPAQTSDLPQEDVGSNKKNAVSIQNGSLAEMDTQEQSNKMETERIVSDSLDLKNEENSKKENDSIDLTKELLAGGRAETEELLSAKVEESQSCAKLGVDNLSDTTSAKVDTTLMVVETKQKSKSEIVLMEGVGMREDEQKVVGTERGEQKLGKIFLKEEFCKEHKVQKEQNQCRNAIHKENKIAQPSLFTLPVAMAGRHGVFPYPGYTPALQTVLPIDPSIRSSNPMKSPPFLLSPPRPKKCATHQYIALNIKHHQQLVKNSKRHAPAGPDLNGAKLQNHSPMSSAHPLLGDICRGQRLNTIPILGGKDQTSGITNIGDSSKDKQLMLQHPLLLLSGSNSLHGPNLMFPLGQHRTMVGSHINQSGSPKPAKAMRKTSLPCNSAVRGETAFNSSSMPADATAISFKGINLHANKAPPMMAMVQNNGYPFSISNNVEMLSPFLAPAIPNVPGPCYSPTFQTFKTHQRPVSHNASPSTGSSSHKQAHSHQQKDPHSSRNSYLMSATTHSQQPPHLPPSHPSKKMGADISTQTSALISKHTFHTQKPSNGHHLSIPIQPINFALMPPGILGTGGKIKSQQQQQGLKVGEELIPQTIAGSVGSTTSATPTLNLSSIAQNPSILHTLPDMSQLSVFICHPNGTA